MLLQQVLNKGFSGIALVLKRIDVGKVELSDILIDLANELADFVISFSVKLKGRVKNLVVVVWSNKFDTPLDNFEVFKFAAMLKNEFIEVELKAIFERSGFAEFLFGLASLKVDNGKCFVCAVDFYAVDFASNGCEGFRVVGIGQENSFGVEGFFGDSLGVAEVLATLIEVV